MYAGGLMGIAVIREVKWSGEGIASFGDACNHDNIQVYFTNTALFSACTLVYELQSNVPNSPRTHDDANLHIHINTLTYSNPFAYF